MSIDKYKLNQVHAAKDVAWQVITEWLDGAFGFHPERLKPHATLVKYMKYLCDESDSRDNTEHRTQKALVHRLVRYCCYDFPDDFARTYECVKHPLYIETAVAQTIENNLALISRDTRRLICWDCPTGCIAHFTYTYDTKMWFRYLKTLLYIEVMRRFWHLPFEIHIDYERHTPGLGGDDTLPSFLMLYGHIKLMHTEKHDG